MNPTAKNVLHWIGWTVLLWFAASMTVVGIDVVWVLLTKESLEDSLGQSAVGFLILGFMGLYIWRHYKSRKEDREVNDEPSSRFPECASCGARPGQAHDPRCPATGAPGPEDLTRSGSRT